MAHTKLVAFPNALSDADKAAYAALSEENKAQVYVALSNLRFTNCRLDLRAPEDFAEHYRAPAECIAQLQAHGLKDFAAVLQNMEDWHDKKTWTFERQQVLHRSLTHIIDEVRGPSRSLLDIWQEEDKAAKPPKTIDAASSKIPLLTSKAGMKLREYTTNYEEVLRGFASHVDRRTLAKHVTGYLRTLSLPQLADLRDLCGIMEGMGDTKSGLTQATIYPFNRLIWNMPFELGEVPAIDLLRATVLYSINASPTKGLEIEPDLNKILARVEMHCPKADERPHISPAQAFAFNYLKSYDEDKGLAGYDPNHDGQHAQRFAEEFVGGYERAAQAAVQRAEAKSGHRR